MRLSVVCGTYNRLPTLQAMLASVRNTIPSWLSYELIVADNGSMDGTTAWLEGQSDIKLLQEGQPVGGIKAFTDAANRASGDYVLIATDDITFPEYAIVRAWSYLESHPSAGAVAFAHNKHVNAEIKVDLQNVYINDQRQAVPYPQIALVRRELGAAAGWWGADDGMKGAFTYGGDNWLGARIYELGYEVHAVTGCYDIEQSINDKPRQMNRARHASDAQLFYSYFANGIHMAKKPALPLRHQETLRILLINDFEPGIPGHRDHKRGLRMALERRGLVWEVDYQALRSSAGPELIKISHAFQPHLILAQIHQPNVIDATVMKAIRSAAPLAVAVNWIGDVWPRLYLDHAEVWRQFDLLGVVNGSMIGPLQRKGINAFYWQAAFEQVEELPEAPAYDAVFLGNGYSPERKQLGKELKALPYHTGLYGRSGHIVPVDGENYWNYATGRALYANARLAISDNQFDAAGYCSNRLFEILSAGGALCLQQTIIGAEEYLGLVEGVHYIGWTDLADLKTKIAYWLDPMRDQERRRIASAAQQLAYQRHSFDVRVDELLSQIESLHEPVKVKA